MPGTRRRGFHHNVFINCPFDDDYRPLLRPLIFTVVALGFQPRLALESSDSGEVRLERIRRIMRESRYSIHDLSRLRLQAPGEMARMNMPFELGMDYGCRIAGDRRMRSKRFLVLGQEPHEYKQALSDIAGWDIKCHRNEPRRMLGIVHNWFIETVDDSPAPVAGSLWHAFLDFMDSFDRWCSLHGYGDDERNELPVSTLVNRMRAWM